MKYIALLRGINAGKERRIDMKRLKSLFESLGYMNVLTYMISGNVFFEVERTRSSDLSTTIEKAIKEEFRSDVAYLFPKIDPKKTIDELPIKKEFIDIRYVKSAIYWNIDRKNYSISYLNKIIGHKLSQLMSLRNVNTARYLAGNRK